MAEDQAAATTSAHTGGNTLSNDPFPLEARVVLQGLQTAPELNNKVGVVKTKLSDSGRQTVYVHELKRSLNVKPINLMYEPRNIDSLSVKELKLVIQSKKIVQDDNEMTGLDKDELKAKVQEAIDSNDEIPEILAKAQEPKSPPPKAKKTSPSPGAASGMPSVDPSQAADQLASMNPEHLRQQARMMRTMPPSQIRSMNPALANMTDAQIRMAADQMEMMANNPQMMQSAAQQMKNMDPAELERMKNQMNNGAQMPATTSSAARSKSSSSSPSSTPTASQAQQAADMMKNMTPEQLKQQAEMLRNMDPATIRSMNPQMAHMTDEQIKMAATQFEMMASNPAMLDMALNQMKNMDPDQMAAMQQQAQSGAGGVNGGPGAGMDPSKMLADMDKDQLKMMLQSLKSNPEMMKQFSQMTGMSEEQLAQGVDMFASMDDSKLEGALKMMQRAQQVKDAWTKVDSKTGGNLKYILIAMAVTFVGLIVWFLFFRVGGSTASTFTTTDNPLTAEGKASSRISAEKEEIVEDEFASEF